MIGKVALWLCLCASLMELNVSNGTAVSESKNKHISGFDANDVWSNSVSCPEIEDWDKLTQTQLIDALTAPCRYDRLERPVSDVANNQSPVIVYARVYIYVMQNLDSSDFQFKIYGLLQVRFMDKRLAFSALAPSRRQPILGESKLRDSIWVPHLFLTNEHDSTVLGTSEKDVLTAIGSDGTITISTRIRANLYCWMDLVKFPFDEQKCSTIIESWLYNSSHLVLHWEENSPITFDPNIFLTEYELNDFWSNETLNDANQTDLRIGAVAGTYSGLSFTVHLTRTVGFYMMDYFLPSMMIVAISWVSFWLQPDQTPARTTLGATTMLSFITLHSSQGKNLPKVSYIKVSEVWFLVCTVFIVGSLVEFAFVNTIWRRNRNVQLKKVTTKYIIKSTVTPTNRRRKFENGKVARQCSTPVSETPVIVIDTDMGTSTDSLNDAHSNHSAININGTDGIDESNEPNSSNITWATMTPKEVALWLDRKARFAFPLAFIIFNALFWTFVYCI